MIEDDDEDENECEYCEDGWVEVPCGISNYERFGGSRSVRCEECSWR
jgi:hypothetical protein